MNDLILVYIPTPSDQVDKIAEELLAKKLIACANILSAHSMYWWQGSIEKNNESIIIGKSLTEYYPRIIEAVSIIHSYQTIPIIKIAVEANEAYYMFIKRELV